MDDLDTLGFYAAIAKNLAGINANLQTLADVYATITERTELDEDLIDLLVAKADEMKIAAQALKTIVFAPPSP